MMAQGQVNRGRRGPVVQGAEQALDQFKYEIARELGIESKIENGYWGNIPSRENGAVGGHMVRRMIEIAERSLQGGQR